jgi:hypothetical protein
MQRRDISRRSPAYRTGSPIPRTGTDLGRSGRSARGEAGGGGGGLVSVAGRRTSPLANLVGLHGPSGFSRRPGGGDPPRGPVGSDGGRFCPIVCAVYARKFERRAQMRWSAGCVWWCVNPSRKLRRFESLADQLADRRSPSGSAVRRESARSMRANSRSTRIEVRLPGFLEPPFECPLGRACALER